jgi:hypothetical protein
MNKKFLISYKIIFALLGFSAIITEIATISERGVFNPTNFFSFFTIETNILVVAVLILSAFALAQRKTPVWLDYLRNATTVFILVVGIGFTFLLAGLEDVVLTAVPWDNIVLHYIMPIAMLVDHILDPPTRELKFRTGLIWLVYPLAYLGYSLVRGSITGWYPYPFLDPSHGGYGSIAIVGLGLLLLGICLTFLLTWISNKRISHNTSST